MKNFKSIDTLKKTILEHEKIAEALQKLKNYWNLSYSSIHAVWYILALLLGLLILTLYWLVNRLEVQHEYLERRDTEMQSQANADPNQNLQPGNQRLFGVKIIPNRPNITSIYKLQGILFDDNPKERIALIQDSSNIIKFYHQGDTLTVGAVIKTIKLKQVEVDESGEVQVLKLTEYPINFLSDLPLPIQGQGNFLK
jgi:hypothetical protein